MKKRSDSIIAMFPQNVSLITTLLLVFTSAIVGGMVAKKLKLPLLLGYIAAGLVFGNLLPVGVDRPILNLTADIGVTLLLFTLGVEFSFHRLRKILGTVVWATVAQILVCLFIFWLILGWLGLPNIAALFIAAAAALSSTAIVVKLLSERGELETIPGEVSTGWLVVQDLSVVPMMVILPVLSVLGVNQSVSFLGTLTLLVQSLAKAGLLVTVIILLGRQGVPRLLNFVVRLGSREIFLLTTVGLVFLAAVVAYGAGLSAALGAFIAGLLVAETSQNHAIFAEVRPLRDLLAVVFFVSLGLLLPMDLLLAKLPFIFTITLLILLVKWFLVAGLCRFLGYHRKTAFLVAVGLLPMSEFGFIIGREGVSLGALTPDQFALLVGLIFASIFAASPVIAHGNTPYYWFYRNLGRFWPKIFPVKEELAREREEYPITGHIVICGYGRVGKYIGRALQMAGIPFIVVDYNHATLAQLRSQGIQVLWGDPADKEVLDFAQVDLARAIVIAIPDRHTQEMIIGNAQTLNRRIKIICRTHHEEDQKDLKALGVHTVIQPEFEAALSIVERLLTDFGVSPEEIAGKVARLKIEHGLG